MIEAKNISKSFENNHVLKDISYIFEEGKTNLIIGKSGSGKTVLMKCLVGLFEVDSGNILFDDRNFCSMSFKQRKVIRQEIGMLFQGGALFDSLTVEENVMFPLRMFTNNSTASNLMRANECLERVNLPKANKLYPAELSGGMKKRVAIARAISMNPKYLFCDEPNSGLDPQTAVVIDDLINEITSEYNMVTIVNTHDLNSVLNIGTRIAFIHEGQLWWHGDKESILKASNPEIKKYLFSNEMMKRLHN